MYWIAAKAGRKVIRVLELLRHPSQIVVRPPMRMSTATQTAERCGQLIAKNDFVAAHGLLTKTAIHQTDFVRISSRPQCLSHECDKRACSTQMFYLFCFFICK